MDERLLHIDPVSGVSQHFSYDDSDDTFTIRTSQDVSDVLEDNKYLNKEHNGNWKGELHRVASIPLALLPELEKKGIMTAGGKILDHAALRRWLNDSNNAYFRTRPGRV